MPQIFEFLHNYSDYIIIGLLLFMSVLMLTMVIERFIFLSRVKVTQYSTIHALEIDLNRNLTVISTIGANAPYVGLLGTVIGILLTFYQIGQSGGDVNAGEIMMHLSLALKYLVLISSAFAISLGGVFCVFLIKPWVAMTNVSVPFTLSQKANSLYCMPPYWVRNSQISVSSSFLNSTGSITDVALRIL